MDPAILKFWAVYTHHPPPVYAVIHCKGSTQPVGYVAAWSSSPSWARRRATEVGGKVQIVKLELCT